MEVGNTELLAKEIVANSGNFGNKKHEQVMFGTRPTENYKHILCIADYVMERPDFHLNLADPGTAIVTGGFI